MSFSYMWGHCEQGTLCFSADDEDEAKKYLGNIVKDVEEWCLEEVENEEE